MRGQCGAPTTPASGPWRQGAQPSPGSERSARLGPGQGSGLAGEEWPPSPRAGDRQASRASAHAPPTHCPKHLGPPRAWLLVPTPDSIPRGPAPPPLGQPLWPVPPSTCLRGHPHPRALSLGCTPEGCHLQPGRPHSHGGAKVGCLPPGSPLPWAPSSAHWGDPLGGSSAPHPRCPRWARWPCPAPAAGAGQRGGPTSTHLQAGSPPEPHPPRPGVGEAGGWKAELAGGWERV